MRSIKEIRNHILKRLNEVYDHNESTSIATILLEHVTQKDKAYILANGHHEINSQQLQFIDGALERLLKMEPIQYVLEEAYFLGRKFFVNRSVLIPRPETEELVNAVIAGNRGMKSILDIGFGSGVIAISLALAIENSSVTALDNSIEAMSVAKKNADHHNASVNWIPLDFLNEEFIHEPFDVIVSNPPYVLESEKDGMETNVLNFEPHNALFVPDNNPFIFYRKIAKSRRSLLANGGRIYLEINERFGDEIIEIFTNEGASSVDILKDINNKDRIVVASF